MSFLLSVATILALVLRFLHGMKQLSTLYADSAGSLEGEAHFCGCLGNEQGTFPFSQYLLCLSRVNHLSLDIVLLQREQRALPEVPLMACEGRS